MAEHKRPRILPVTYFIGFALAAALANTYLPLYRLFSPPVSYIGAILVLGGAGVILAGVILFGKARTGLLPFDAATVVVSNGIFRYSRNPMYLGMTTTLAGIGVLLGDLSALLGVPVFAAILHFRFILPEEKFMEQSLGEQYLAYRTRVRRWL